MDLRNKYYDKILEEFSMMAFRTLSGLSFDCLNLALGDRYKQTTDVIHDIFDRQTSLSEQHRVRFTGPPTREARRW